MRYSQVAFICRGGEGWEQDLLIADLAGLGFESFENQETGFLAYIPVAQYDMQALETLLLHQPAGFDVNYNYQEIEPQNWNAVWESNFDPITIGGQCHVRALFHPAQPGFPYEIVIHPKMAFGTGHHQTTSMMVEYLLEDDFDGKRVLDMGSGTGILAIMAIKRGALHADAYDNDPVCVDSVVENATLNDAASIRATCGSEELIAGETYDVILANINRNILLMHLPAYAASLVAGGALYLSGFYAGEDLQMLTDKASDHGLVFEKVKQQDKWVAARYIKR
jgi:ribosomal protein L11 methyltransferase